MHVDAPRRAKARSRRDRARAATRRGRAPERVVSVDELPQHQQGGAGRDGIESTRRLWCSEVHAERDEGEGPVGDEPWLALEEPREERADHDRPADPCQKLRHARGRERSHEQDCAHARVAEAGDPVSSCPRDKQHRKADARDGPGDLGEPDHFGLTRTSAVAECPRSVTTRRYVPGVVGARRCSSLPRRRPRCWPRRHL